MVLISSWARKACSNGEDTPNRWSKAWRTVCVLALKPVSSSYVALSVWLCRVVFNTFILHSEPCNAAATIGFRQDSWLIAEGKRHGRKLRVMRCVRGVCSAQLPFGNQTQGDKGALSLLNWDWSWCRLRKNKPMAHSEEARVGRISRAVAPVRSHCCVSAVTEVCWGERRHFKQWHLNVA